MKPVVVVTGTRPEIIKMAPILRALKEAALPHVFVHCGQHYDYNMAQQFIENLELAVPDHWLKIDSSSPGTQTAEILLKMDTLIGNIEPSVMLVEGDTNTVLSAALAANKRVVPIGHVEAGHRTRESKPSEGECLGQNFSHRQHSHRRREPAFASCRKEIHDHATNPIQNVRVGDGTSGRKR
jgi:UDP-N-acetylglucosamine 2-epimerase (non-hydrolysing)